jgi:hypothetical protein
MKDKYDRNGARLAPAMVEDKATERLKKRAQDLGLIVNAGADKAAKPAGKKENDRKKTEARQ